MVTYFRWPSGPDYTLEQIQSELAKGILNLECNMRPSNEKDFRPVSEILAMAPPTSPRPTSAPSISAPPTTKPKIVSALTARYSDAYIVAHTVIIVGTVIKWVGVVLSITIFIGSIAVSPDRSNTGLFAFIGFAVACVVGVPTFVLGILVSAQGQIHLATLDTSVNSSRHLSDDEVAKILVGQKV